MNCSSVKERLVDFLYDELPADARAVFEDHLRACPRCKAEVASYRATLGSTRSALSGPLAKDPPVRVRDAVMEVAKAAARAATPKKPELGFFARLWRTPWLMPAFGAASVATVVLLVRVLKNPEVIPGQRATSIGEMTEPTPTRASAPAPEEQTAEGVSPNRGKAGPEKSARMLADEPYGEKPGVQNTKDAPREVRRARKEERRSSAEVPVGGLGLDRDVLGRSDKASASAGAHKKADRADALLLEEAGQRRPAAPSRFAEPPPARQEEKAEKADDGATEQRRLRLKELGQPGGAARAHDDATEDSFSNAHAARAKRDVAPTPAPAKPAGHAPAMAASPLPVAAPAPAAAPAPPPGPSMKKRAEVAAEAEASYAAGAVTQGEPSDHKKGEAQPASPLSEAIRRADRLFADGNWSAAAEAYRELLRRYPSYSEAGKWRSRMDQALLAGREIDEAAKRQAKAKAAGRDTLQREKP
jgi:hypothetical protein